MSGITFEEKKFLDKYNLYDPFYYDHAEDRQISITYPVNAKLTSKQMSEIIKKTGANDCSEDKVLTFGDNKIKLRCTDPVLAEVVHNNQEDSKLKVMNISVDFNLYNISKKKTHIEYGLISSVVYNEKYFKENSIYTTYDDSTLWYHVYDFTPRHFIDLDYNYYLIQLKFIYKEIINSNLNDQEKLEILQELANI